MNIRLIIFTAGLVILVGSLWAQSDREQEIKVTLTNGTILRGTILDRDSAYLHLRSLSLGTLQIPLSEVASLENIQDIVSISSEPENKGSNSNPSRGFLSETGFAIPKNRWLYQNLALGGHLVSFGVTDHLTMTGGIEFFSLFGGEAPIFLLAPKYTFGRDDDLVRFAIGVNTLITPYDNTFISSVYGVGTIGSKDNNFTLGFARLATDIWAGQLGFNIKLNDHLGLVTENFLGFDEGNFLVSYSGYLRIQLSTQANIYAGIIALQEEFFDNSEGILVPSAGASYQF